MKGNARYKAISITVPPQIEQQLEQLCRNESRSRSEVVREALRRMGRADLIGNGKQHLVPTYQPIGTGHSHEGKRKPKATTGSSKPVQPFRTQHTGLPKVPARKPGSGRPRGPR